MTEAFIFHGTRTPFGRHAGALAPVRSDDLLAAALGRLVEQSAVPPEAVEEVIAGCANQAGEDSRNVARHGALLAGLPVMIGALTVNRLCGSGLAAVADAARVIACEQGELMIAGGVESMSRAPFILAKAEAPYSRQFESYDSTLGYRFPNPAFVAKFGNATNPEVGDNCAREYGVSREDADRFALRSQQNYARALAAGFFDEEITTAVRVRAGKNERTVTKDEPPRPESTLEGLTALRTVNAGGVVTAGNASSVNDGAAALLLGSREAGQRHGWRPRARVVSAAVAGIEPRLFGIAPIASTAKALARAGLSLRDMDLIEINEAFASQVLACLRGLEIADDDPRVNPNGGAIAIGHPLGASGARLAFTAVRELERSGKRYALVSLCIGVGQGISVILERV